MSGEALTQEELFTIFEAGRWAPSSYNVQPWRFVYGLAETPEFAAILGLLIEFNQAWAHKAGALVLVTSSKVDASGKPFPTHAFDAGAAWMSMALQATKMGLVAHAMAGYSPEKAREALAIPEEFETHCVVAFGRPGSPDDLPPKLKAREVQSDRRPLAELAFRGRFPG
jgi:nitroreductase